MSISDVASLLGGAALGAPVSEIFKLIIAEARKVNDFKPLSQDLASTMESLVPICEEIDKMQGGWSSGNDELKVLIKRAVELVSKCSRVEWYSFTKKASYTRKIKGMNQDFFKFCQINLQLIQHMNLLQSMRSISTVSTKIDLLSDTGKKISELSMVPHPETVTIFWLIRPMMELKKKLFEDGVVSVVVTAPSPCGKTTLVTKLCHDAEVRGKFKQIFFITVSKAPNVRLTVQRLLEHTGCQSNEIANNLDAGLCIQELLKKLGKNGSILLVLDDVWPEEESLLVKFLIKLSDYKILVTSRFEFPSFGPTFHLEPLIDEDVKNLFRECTPEPNCQSCSKHVHNLQKSADAPSHRAMIDAYLKAERIDDALRMLYRMVDVNLRVVAEFGTRVFSELIKNGKLTESAEVLTKMGEKEPKPDPSIYDVVVRGLCDGGALDQAKDMISQMVGYAVGVDHVLREFIIETFEKAGRREEIKKTLNTVNRPVRNPGQSGNNTPPSVPAVLGPTLAAPQQPRKRAPWESQGERLPNSGWANGTTGQTIGNSSVNQQQQSWPNQQQYAPSWSSQAPGHQPQQSWSQQQGWSSPAGHQQQWGNQNTGHHQQWGNQNTGHQQQWGNQNTGHQQQWANQNTGHQQPWANQNTGHQHNQTGQQQPWGNQTGQQQQWANQTGQHQQWANQTGQHSAWRKQQQQPWSNQAPLPNSVDSHRST